MGTKRKAQKTMAELTRERADVLSDALREEGFGVRKPNWLVPGERQILYVEAPVLVVPGTPGWPYEERVHEHGRTVRSRAEKEETFTIAEINVETDGAILVSERVDIEMLADGRLRFGEPQGAARPWSHSGSIVVNLLRRRGLGEWVRRASLGFN